MKTLHRSETSKMVAGVCGGVGEYLDIDPNIVRIVFILLFAFGFITLFWPLFLVIFYVTAMILLPTGTTSAGEVKNLQE